MGSQPISARRQRWTRLRIVTAAKVWAHRHGGRAPTAGDWAAATTLHPSHTTVEREFGPGDAWARLRDEAGLEDPATPFEVLGEAMDLPRPPGSAHDELERHARFLAAGGRMTRERYLSMARCAVACAGALERPAA